MITRHYKRIVKDILQRGGAKFDAYAVTASDGRPYYTAQEQPNYSADQTAMSMSTDQPGVIIGNGTAAESETSYWLAQQITSGFSGSVLPTHEMVDGTHTLCLYVTINNTGSSSITVSEIGYALITPLMRRPSDFQTIGSPYAVERNVLIDRTVLASPITIAAGNSVRLKYALKTTDEIFSGSVVLIQKTINVNGVYNASSDNANGYSEVTVNVTPNLQSKTVTQNGTVTPDTGYDGLSSVTVNVSGGSSVDKTLQNSALIDCYTRGGLIGGFKNSSAIWQPMDENGNMLDVDWSKPFVIHLKFKLIGTKASQCLFGTYLSNSYYGTPTIEIHTTIMEFWCGISSTGNSWSEQASITTVPIVVGGEYEITCEYDGGDYTITISDGTNVGTAVITMSAAPYHSSSYKIGFGNIAKSTTLYAQYVYFDPDNTYIESQGTLIWGSKGV